MFFFYKKSPFSNCNDDIFQWKLTFLQWTFRVFISKSVVFTEKSTFYTKKLVFSAKYLICIFHLKPIIILWKFLKSAFYLSSVFFCETRRGLFSDFPRVTNNKWCKFSIYQCTSWTSPPKSTTLFMHTHLHPVWKKTYINEAQTIIKNQQYSVIILFLSL